MGIPQTAARQVVLVVALVLAVLVGLIPLAAAAEDPSPSPSPTPSPTPAPAPSRAPISDEDRALLAQLRSDAERQFELLAEATEAYEKGREELVQAEADAEAAEEAAREALERYKIARGELELYVGAAYRTPLPRDVLLLAVQTSGEEDALRTATDLEQMSNNQSNVVDRTEGLRDAALELAEEAEAKRDEAEKRAEELDATREELVETSEEVTLKLTDAVERLGGAGGSRASAAQVWSCDGTTLIEVGVWPNGLIPADALCDLPQEDHRLRGDAAKAFIELNAAFNQRFGRDICLISTYRPLATQHRLYATRPHLAAVPGHSNHGWGMAVDLCNEEGRFYTPQYNWLKANSARWGWVHPDWAEPDGSRPESWHWEYAIG